MIELDATLIAEAFQKGIEVGFMLAVETQELDEQLNINKIDEPKEDAEGI